MTEQNKKNKPDVPISLKIDAEAYKKIREIVYKEDIRRYQNHKYLNHNNSKSPYYKKYNLSFWVREAINVYLEAWEQKDDFPVDIEKFKRVVKNIAEAKIEKPAE